MAKPKLDLTHPEVAKKWHPTKNGDLKPSDVTFGSCKIVWWKCPEGDDHEWPAAIANRTKKIKPTGCACCSGHRVCKDNRLDLLFPKVAKEWHPSKNGDLKPSDFTYGSKKIVWWKCPKGVDHEWPASINNRTKKNKPSGCACCSGHRVCKDNRLDLLFPEVAKEWHPTKNGNLKPSDVPFGSRKIVWWKCPERDDHEWPAGIASRTKKIKPTGCACCSGHRVCKDNRLDLLFPKIAKEWHPTKNGDLKPSDFTCGSKKIVW
jgi:hypothetical protein